MHRTTPLSFLLSTALLLSGCVATGEKFRREVPAHPQEALLYIYRPSGFIGSAQRPDIRIDGENLGSVVSGGYLVKKVTIGRHTLVLTGGGNPFTWNFPDRTEVANINASGNYYYRYAPSSSMNGPNVIVHSYSFGQVAEAQALEELSSLNRAQ